MSELPVSPPPTTDRSPLADSAFDANRPMRLSPDVGLRPEPFGALAYHFHTRRLVFLKSKALVELVRSLEHHESAAAAIAAAPRAHSAKSYRRALASLEASEVVSGA